MRPVYLSHPRKQFSGTRAPLLDLALEAVLPTLEDGARPSRILLASAHPLELGDVDGDTLAGQLAHALRGRGFPMPTEYFSNPNPTHPSAHLAASATGAAVFHEAARGIAAGDEPSILVVAVEQMRLKGREETTRVLQSLIQEEERRYGVTMPALGALLQQALAAAIPGLPQALEALMLANRARTVLNPAAHIRKEVRREDLHGPRNPAISTPLRLYDVAPMSSGHASVLLTCAAPPGPAVVQLAGLGQGRDHLALGRRARLDRSAATLEAREMLLKDLGWNLAELRRRVRYAEIHDAFPVIEFLGLLDTGLLDAGSAVEQILAGELGPSGRLPVNLSGGVMGGHPVGATGLGQLVELCKLALGNSQDVAAPARPGFSLAFNVGGPLTYNFLTLLECRMAADPETLYWIPRRPAFTLADFDLEPACLPALPCAGRLMASTLLHVPPPGYESPLHLGMVEVGSRAHLVHVSGQHRPGTRVWLHAHRGLLRAGSGPAPETSDPARARA